MSCPVIARVMTRTYNPSFFGGTVVIDNQSKLHGSEFRERKNRGLRMLRARRIANTAIAAIIGGFRFAIVVIFGN